MFNRILIIITLWFTVLCLASNAYSKEVVSVVVLSFTDNTEYTELNTDEIIDKLLLDKLMNIETLHIYEYMVTNESLEIEKDLVGNADKVANALTEKNFTLLFKTSKDDITFKKQGEYLSCLRTKTIGQKYGVDYIIHGSVDFIGGKERERKIVWDDLKYGHSSNIVTVLSTLRIIEANTGKIVWCHREKGRVKDRFDSLSNFSYGTKEFSNHLFYEALDEISEKMVRKLRNDLDKGILQMKNSKFGL